MRKASDILYMVGIIMALLGLTIYVVMTFASYRISNPGYTETLISQLESGSVTSDFPGTYAEQAAQIQHMFLIFAIVLTIFTVINIAKFVIAITAKRSRDNRFIITSLVLGGLSFDTLIILAAIFGLVANKQEKDIEEISASF